jgi:hypothetical protein
MSVLVSLPSLENVILETFASAKPPPGGELRGLMNLLKSPSLRSIEFYKFSFTSDVSQALLVAFQEGSFVANLRFTECYLGKDVDYYDDDDYDEDDDDGNEDDDQAGTVRALVRGLQRNSFVKTLSIADNDFDRLGRYGFNGLFCDGMATALLVNTTLVDLTLRVPSLEGDRWLQPLFISMRINTSLKSLHVNYFRFTDESVCESLRDMLAQNSVLESLTLQSPECSDEIGVVSWHKTLPFIRDKTTLKSLTISFDEDEVDPNVATLCFNSVATLEGNTTLECLNIKTGGIDPDAYFTALESLQSSSRLRTLQLSPVSHALNSIWSAKMKELGPILRKNYSLEVLDEGLSAMDGTGEVGTLLRLNQAGRRYLITDSASVAKGVEVLIGVSDDLGCLFYRLLENPTLCDIEYQYDAKIKSGTGNCTHLNKHQRIQS